MESGFAVCRFTFAIVAFRVIDTICIQTIDFIRAANFGSIFDTCIIPEVIAIIAFPEKARTVFTFTRFPAVNERFTRFIMGTTIIDIILLAGVAIFMISLATCCNPALTGRTIGFGGVGDACGCTDCIACAAVLVIGCIVDTCTVTIRKR